ncbi:MAG: ABC transporter ATP-binding protein, partial [Panacagrimonas sp.]
AGTVLLVSHDRAFLDAVVTRTLLFEGDGRIDEYVGGYGDMTRQRPVAQPAPIARAAVAAPRAAAAESGLSAKERRELDELPGRIEQMEADQAALAESISTAGLYERDRTRALEVQARLSEIAERLTTAYARWESLESRRSARR